MDDKRNLQAPSPGPSILPLPHPSPLSHTYIEPSLRLPAPQPQLTPATTIPQQPQLSPNHHQHSHPQQQHHHHHHHHNGLGLLLEAFGTHHADAIPPNLPPSNTIAPPATPYDAPGAAAAYYSAAEAMPPDNEAYEYELQCLVSDGMPVLQHGWVGGGMYGY